MREPRTKGERLAIAFDKACREAGVGPIAGTVFCTQRAHDALVAGGMSTEGLVVCDALFKQDGATPEAKQ